MSLDFMVPHVCINCDLKVYLLDTISGGLQVYVTLDASFLF